jgi:hypothetical protein
MFTQLTESQQSAWPDYVLFFYKAANVAKQQDPLPLDLSFGTG